MQSAAVADDNDRAVAGKSANGCDCAGLGCDNRRAARRTDIDAEIHCHRAKLCISLLAVTLHDPARTDRPRQRSRSFHVRNRLRIVALFALLLFAEFLAFFADAFALGQTFLACFKLRLALGFFFCDKVGNDTLKFLRAGLTFCKLLYKSALASLYLL